MKYVSTKHVCRRTGDIIFTGESGDIIIESSIPKNEIELGLVDYKEPVKEMRIENKIFKWFK